MVAVAPEHAPARDCDRCGEPKVARERLQYTVTVRDWSSADPTATKQLLLTDALCSSCYERAVRQNEGEK